MQYRLRSDFERKSQILACATWCFGYFQIGSMECLLHKQTIELGDSCSTFHVHFFAFKYGKLISPHLTNCQVENIDLQI